MAEFQRTAHGTVGFENHGRILQWVVANECEELAGGTGSDRAGGSKELPALCTAGVGRALVSQRKRHGWKRP
jgi:hypothetical protein